MRHLGSSSVARYGCGLLCGSEMRCTFTVSLGCFSRREKCPADFYRILMSLALILNRSRPQTTQCRKKISNWQGMGNLLKPPRQYLNWTIVEVKRLQNVALRCPNRNCALWEPTNVVYNILRDSGKLPWKEPFQDTGKCIDKDFQVPGLTDRRDFHALKR